MGGFINFLGYTGILGVMITGKEEGTVFDPFNVGPGLIGRPVIMIPDYKEEKQKPTEKGGGYSTSYATDTVEPGFLDSFYRMLERYGTKIKELPRSALRDYFGDVLGYRTGDASYVDKSLPETYKMVVAAHEALSGHDHSKSHYQIQRDVESLFRELSDVDPRFAAAYRLAIADGERNGWRD